jgi:hypothetical protein
LSVKCAKIPETTEYFLLGFFQFVLLPFPTHTGWPHDFGRFFLLCFVTNVNLVAPNKTKEAKQFFIMVELFNRNYETDITLLNNVYNTDQVSFLLHFSSHKVSGM